ncbi:M56 family metallopeptidase [uncultured Stenotrophomonas sp.]|uniref:M56 family metallopeptidase n=1 Tax=uncultured Stenotrophomonas sp. TaxID=165438 RepID=UPI0028D736EF|nr:M56 family metallopeptidase [uncultured Stenotrophomonas sp.]
MTVHWTQALASFALQHLWHSALLFALATLVVSRSRLGAEARSWLFCAAFALAATSPLLVLRPTTPHTSAPTPRLEAPVAPTVGRPTHPHHQPTPTNPPTLLQGMALLWLLGTTYALLQLLRGIAQASTLHRTSRRAQDLNALLGRDLPYATTVARSDSVAGPMVVGLFAPRILVPTHLADTLAPAALRDLLLHEAAHIRRNDLWIAAAQRVVLAVYWWSPFLRLLGKRLDLAREIACDTRAAAQGGSGRGYADSLLTGISGLGTPARGNTPLAVAMSGSRSGLSQRIDNLLRLDTARTAWTTRLLWSGLCVLALGGHLSVTVAATPRLGTAPQRVVDDEPARDASPNAERLLAAAADGDVAELQHLINAGTAVDTSVRGDGTALIMAARNGQLTAVDALLALGAQPDLHATGDGNPPIAAARRGHLPVVERLVAAGADVNRIVPYDETPLINAARSGDVDTVAFLIDHGADVNLGVVADAGQWRSPLNQARNPRVRDYLVQRGALADRR